MEQAEAAVDPEVQEESVLTDATARMPQPDQELKAQGKSPEIHSNSPDSSWSSAHRSLLGFTIAISLLVITLEVLARLDVRTLWDDAYMFQRYAYNVIHHRAVSWNPEGPPAYGLTSPSFLLIGIPLQLLTQGNMSLSAMLSSIVAGVLAIGMAMNLAVRTLEARHERWVAATLCMFYLAYSTYSDHCVSGMDTTWGLAYLFFYLWNAHRLVQGGGKKAIIITGILGGLGFWVRPESLVVTFLLPMMLIAFPRAGTSQRRDGIRVLATSAGVLLLLLVIGQLYFKSALPLPFYAKATNLYGTGIRRAYSLGSTVDFLSWLGYSWLLLALVLVDIFSGPRRYFKQSTALEKAAFVSSLILIAYAWIIVTPIMGFSSRFYFPAVPGLMYAAIRSVGRLMDSSATESKPSDTTAITKAATTVMVGYGLSLLFPIVVTAGKEIVGNINARTFARFDIHAHSRESGPQKYWFAFDRFAELPNDAVIATTEVGMISALKGNLPKTVVDMAGLNEPRFSLKPFSAAAFFDAYLPDLIYMPHPHYVNMTEDLQKHPSFSKYEVFSKSQLGTNDFGLAIRKDSKHYDKMRAIVGSKIPVPAAIPAPRNFR